MKRAKCYIELGVGDGEPCVEEEGKDGIDLRKQERAGCKLNTHPQVAKSMNFPQPAPVLFSNITHK